MWIPFLTLVNCMTLGTVLSQSMPQFLHPWKGHKNRTRQRTVKRLKWNNVLKACKNRAWHVVFKILLSFSYLKVLQGEYYFAHFRWLNRGTRQLKKGNSISCQSPCPKNCAQLFLFAETQCWPIIVHGIHWNHSSLWNLLYSSVCCWHENKDHFLGMKFEAIA